MEDAIHAAPGAPAVSVAMVTFEQERFIAEAIESVLAQQFKGWEIVMGDDHSGDATVDVARFYQRAHPTRVRILSADSHMGPRANFIRTLEACRGRYIVQLDGDDYFTSPQKLAAQVEFLDANPDCALTFHASIDVDESGGPLGRPFRPPGRRPRYTVRDLARRNLANSSAVLFRRGLFGEFPEWFSRVPVGDWPLQVMNACHGDIGYTDEVMSAHRKHASGVWVKKSAVAQLESKLSTRRFLLEFLGPEFADVIGEGLSKDTFKLALAHERAGDHGDARAALEACRALGEPGRAVPAMKFWPLYWRTVWKTRGVVRGAP